MPKSKMDYKDMVIYKICCKDLNIKDIYVGHTCNLVKRRWRHKNCCNNENGKYNTNVYQFIRQNGGFDNWEVIEIEKCPCLNFEEAVKIERHYIETLKASLNMVIPTRTTKEYYYDNKEMRLENHKKWVDRNPEKVKEYTKQYKEKNREKLLLQNREKSRKYREENKDKIIDNRRIQYQKNREKLLEKVKCDCGCIVNYIGLLRHKKSQKHLKCVSEQ